MEHSEDLSTPTDGLVKIALWASDDISRAGVISLLADDPRVQLMGDGETTTADVLVVTVEKSFPISVLTSMRTSTVKSAPIVLIENEMAEQHVVAAIRFGVLGVVPRRLATRERLVITVIAVAARHGVLPSRIVGAALELFMPTYRTQSWARNSEAFLPGLEYDIVRHLAEGLSTAEIAREVHLSERSVKNYTTRIVRAMQAKNRPHAVANAIRQGLI